VGHPHWLTIEFVHHQFVVATEALAAGRLTRSDLERDHVKVYRNVYVRRGVELTARERAYAAWLWSGRRATLVGHSAAAMLGSKWIPADAPVELAHSRRPAARGITVHSSIFRTDELCTVDGIRCSSVARTAYDLGRRLPLDTGIIRIDALLNATRVPAKAVEVVGAHHPGDRGICRLRQAMDMVDAGAESPQETRLRLLLVRSGLPRPVTQIPVTNDWGDVVRRIDMGWSTWLVGAEYDGAQHWQDPRQHERDIERLEFLAQKGWTVIRVSATQLRSRRDEVVQRVRAGLQRAGYPD
jgi:hypothetical protein